MTTPTRPFLSRFSWKDWIILAAILLLIGITFGLTFYTSQITAATATPTPSLTHTLTLSPSPSLTFTPTSQPSITVAAITPTPGPLSQGLMVLSMMDAGFFHLFATQPGVIPLTRLTANPWDDITPALSPDGNRIAFSSRQNGYWDLFVMDLANGSLIRLTDTANYDASPAWSPDGQWLVYETYNGSDFDIYICSAVDPLQAPIRLTEAESADYSPTWSPGGRSIVFVSDRAGQADIWLADLDRSDDRFINLSQSSLAVDAHPTWSPDGSQLAWSSITAGTTHLVIWDSASRQIRTFAAGDWPVWSPDGTYLSTLVQMPNQSYFAIYSATNGEIALPAESLSGALQGLSWGQADLPAPLPGGLGAASRLNPTPLWTTILTPTAAGPAGRQRIVPLNDVTAPRPMLHDRVDEAFQALRSRVAQELGWDYLANLENAFITLTDPLPPARQEDWLYTGRSFAANTVPLNAGWLMLVEESFAGQTYWHVYVKTRFQDGSQGAPIRQRIFDVNARYRGDPQLYDLGGDLSAVPPIGYWLDLTSLALAYGWERLPSLVEWRSYFPGLRFNQFILSEGLDWRSAMLEIYPPEILLTATPFMPPSATPTRTPYGYQTRTPTPTPVPTQTSTRRPTWTPRSP